MKTAAKSRITTGIAVLFSTLAVGGAVTQDWHPAPAPLLTRWAKEVSPTNALPEYPRPQTVRGRWLNLNGLRDYALTKDTEVTAPENYTGQILVPFPYESALSGIGKPSIPNQCLWYHRTFSIPPAWHGQRVLLHFGAVNWETTVWVNGKEAGRHRGGYDGFTLDITDVLKARENDLMVSAWNPLLHDRPDSQVLGKQREVPAGVLYTAASGIWQTVWLESVQPEHISRLKLIPDIDGTQLSVRVEAGGLVMATLKIFKDHGCNYVRLRLFLAPNGQEGQVNSLSYTLQLAKRVKSAGLKLLLDLHYSDGWADPTHQSMPAEWLGLSHQELVARVLSYTQETIAAFQREGCLPDMVEVGNEITNGMLWPDAGPLSEPAKWNEAANPNPVENPQWDNFADLLKAGIRGVREVDARRSVKIMIHIDKGGSAALSRSFFDQLQRRSVNFDVIGLSYYPFWHGTLAALTKNLASLARTFQKDIIVVETGYDTWCGDQKKLPYPITPAGQKQFLDGLLRAVAATPDGRGAGVFYWAPEWIMGQKWNAPSWSGVWEDRALFDHHGDMLPAMQAFEFESKPTAGMAR
jgi:arabinogalactan endo-1,4-beta-galactosidase